MDEARPSRTALRVANGGRQAVLVKRDIGYGQGPGQAIPYRLDIYDRAATPLGVTKTTVAIALAPASGTAATLDQLPAPPTPPNTSAVFARFTVKVVADESASSGHLTAEQFKKIVNEVKAETGAKGKELFHPIRIVITGSHSGPDFDRLIPILEAGSHLHLPKHVLSVRERVQEFGKAETKNSATDLH